jgi:hypothetical protein
MMAAVVPYIGVVVVTLLLNAARYWSGYAMLTAEQFPLLFSPRFAPGDVVWFLTAVSVPVILMLAGGFALIRGHALGRYMGWWTFAYAMADGVIHLGVEFTAAGYDHRFFLGALAALAQITIGAIGWMRLAGGSSPQIVEPKGRALTANEINLWTIGFVAFVAAYGLTLYSQAGYLPVIVIIGSMIGGLFAWRQTSARRPADRMKTVPLYLLMLALFYIHVGEEALTGFNHAIAAISGKPWSDPDFVVFIGLLGPALWVAGGLGMWLRKPWGDFLVWFMTVGMMLGELTHHVIFPFMAAAKFGIGYTYFSGMVSALFPLIPAVLLAFTLLSAHRTATLVQRSRTGTTELHRLAN